MNNIWENSNIQYNCTQCVGDEPYFMLFTDYDFFASGAPNIPAQPEFVIGQRCGGTGSRIQAEVIETLPAAEATALIELGRPSHTTVRRDAERALIG